MTEPFFTPDEVAEAAKFALYDFLLESGLMDKAIPMMPPNEPNNAELEKLFWDVHKLAIDAGVEWPFERVKGTTVH